MISYRDLPGGALPKSLADRSTLATLEVGDGIPALLARPDSADPAPVLIWLHGRTVDKFLDPGRYSRLVRAGVAVCAIDLPGHGERVSLLGEERKHDPVHSLGVIAQAVGEIDGVVRALGHADGFDADRVAIGGMSLGGMVTLRRLCEPHRFGCAAVEATSGNLAGLYFPDEADGAHREGWPVEHRPEDVARVDPMAHMETMAPLPLLVLHSEADEMVPWAVQRKFLDAVRERYESAGADAAMLEVRTWPETGAPQEHVGFGRVSHEAKTLQTRFVVGHLAEPA